MPKVMNLFDPKICVDAKQMPRRAGALRIGKLNCMKGLVSMMKQHTENLP